MPITTFWPSGPWRSIPSPAAMVVVVAAAVNGFSITQVRYAPASAERGNEVDAGNVAVNAGMVDEAANVMMLLVTMSALVSV